MRFKISLRKRNFLKAGQRTLNNTGKYFIDNSFLDVWLSDEIDYSYHWEQRALRGLIHRWDNAPDHPEIESFPHHFHDGDESNVIGSNLDKDCRVAIREVLEFIADRLKESRKD